MNIGDVSKNTGISIDALRYYDKINLVSPMRNGKNREYSESDIEKLNFIKILKNAYFPLDEIRFLFKMEDIYKTEREILSMTKNDVENLSKLIKNNVSKIETQIENLKKAKDILDGMIKKVKILEER